MSATTGVPASITVQTSRLGTLEFHDGAPTPETAERLYDNLDFVRGVEAFLNSYQAASVHAIRRGFREPAQPYSTRPGASEFEPYSPGSNGHDPTTGR